MIVKKQTLFIKNSSTPSDINNNPGDSINRLPAFFLNKLSHMAVLFIILSLFGCSTTDSHHECQNMDWYELGRRAGTKGQPNKEDEDLVRCQKSQTEAHQKIYLNGYNSGLSEYCTLENGFALGKSGQPSQASCPTPLNEAFNIGYERGQKVRELEIQNQTLDRQIASLNEKMKAATQNGDQSESTEIKAELKELTQTFQANEKKLHQIEKSKAN